MKTIEHSINSYYEQKQLWEENSARSTRVRLARAIYVFENYVERTPLNPSFFTKLFPNLADFIHSLSYEIRSYFYRRALDRITRDTK